MDYTPSTLGVCVGIRTATGMWTQKVSMDSNFFLSGFDVGSKHTNPLQK